MYGYYHSEEEKAEAIKKTVDEYRAAAGFFPAIRRAIEKFDGKVLNCRLEKAMQEETGKRIYVSKDKSSVDIHYYGSTYSGNTYITLARIDAEKLTDGKRIPAAVLIQAAREKREEHLKEAAKLEEVAERVEQIKYQIEYFRGQASKLAGALPYEIRDVYNIQHSY